MAIEYLKCGKPEADRAEDDAKVADDIAAEHVRVMTDKAAAVIGEFGSRPCMLEGPGGHAGQCNIRVRRFGGLNVPYGEAAPYRDAAE